ncbi:EscU/YscU/HrcU family type III secretion system export apparatus switch protein [Ectothiorhodospira sp. BSL-9]|uniref:EscU/YscU/HrcU family type III secretion system export apparatus switch protein n=1 Tax=Ectothiorhodospira sp. BSL-9 TaxID=1442136 RepID=UPI0009EEED64|nr:EscU/YscU/HrcU family type III secretion system export apparatus switch protein [Ectothiorhodospira sp. BSL-9]TVQ73195.1 MAG: type III secretion protein [Chromatiaceae bacterium]
MSGKHSRPESRQAIALKYTGKGAPRLTAKGGGDIARQILELADEHGVPVHEDAALTSALAQIPLGDEIPENLYVAVAEVLAFVYMLSGRRPGDVRPGQASDKEEGVVAVTPRRDRQSQEGD